MNGLQHFGFTTAVAGAVLALGSLTVSTVRAESDHGVDHDKVTICHATASETNPYVEETVSVRAVDGEGVNDHSHHTGPIWYAGAKAADVDWGDIIPPLDEGDAGLNWTTDGQAIWHNGCSIPVVVTTTTTVADVTTTTIVDVTTTTVVDVTTTTVADATTTTVADATTTTLEAGGPTTTVTPTTVAPTTSVGDESGGPTTTTSTMPVTGSGQQMLLLTGLAMVGFGLLARMVGRRSSDA